MNLMRAESPGPSVSKFVPKVQSTAKILYTIYLGMTVLQIILCCLAVYLYLILFVLLFGSAGTGGFGIKNDSMASYSTYCQVVTTVFIILFGVNFSAYYLILTKKFKQAFKLEEVRYYFGIILASVILIAVNTRHMFSGFAEAFSSQHSGWFYYYNHRLFSTDFNQWPALSNDSGSAYVCWCLCRKYRRRYQRFPVLFFSVRQPERSFSYTFTQMR